VLTELDLNLLHALYALLTERHVTRAGQRVGLSQPAMSSALARLRRYFDDELLRREGNHYYLTPLALELLGPLEEMVHQVERTLALRARFDPMTSRRELRLQVSDYTLVVLMRPLLALAASEAPGVRLRFEGIEWPYQSQTLEHSVDLLVAPPIVRSDEHVPLWKDDWVVAVAMDHPEVGDAIALGQLADLPYIRFQAAGVLNPADRQLAQLGVDVQVAASVSSWIGAMFLVAGTRALTLVPEHLGRRFADVCGTRILDPPISLEPIEEWLHWSSREESDPGVLWLRELVQKVVGQLDLSRVRSRKRAAFGPAALVEATRLVGTPAPPV
jgi:DNA-binding transcriptional LysR family regulator